MGAREDIARAIIEGDLAARNGEPPSRCPYPRTDILRTAWIRGYARARPVTEPDE
ncbi:Rmf/CrpP fold protein [Streptomyces sp. NPDC058527]|uniref:Rmf/CrpP fold protein n=1 Tax=unclassified Streptomyces TaxID=2593676 RepID=UPI0036544BE8